MAQRSDIWTEQEAMTLLAPYEEALMKTVWRAWKDRDDRFTRDDMMGNSISPRLSAEFMWERMNRHALELLEQACPNDLRIIELNGPTIHYAFPCNIRVRFKKLDVDGKTSNILTGQEVLFRQHDIERLELDLTVGKHALLAVGYVLDEMGIDIVDVAISCRDPENTSEILWYRSILNLAWMQQVDASYLPQDVTPRAGQVPVAVPATAIRPAGASPAQPNVATAHGVANDDAEVEVVEDASDFPRIVARTTPLEEHQPSEDISIPTAKPAVEESESEEEATE